MSTLGIVLLIIIAVLAIVLAVLYFLGKKAQKKQDAQQEQIKAAAQTCSMLIIDKKMMKLKDAGLPDIVVEQTPWYMKRVKMPIVKAKVGPRIMTMICDQKIFDQIPVKKEVKASVSGIYITWVKGLHSSQQASPEKKKGFFKKLFNK